MRRTDALFAGAMLANSRVAYLQLRLGSSVFTCAAGARAGRAGNWRRGVATFSWTAVTNCHSAVDSSGTSGPASSRSVVASGMATGMLGSSSLSCVGSGPVLSMTEALWAC
jgi:hypothetical protein